MSGPVLSTLAAAGSEAFEANAAHNRALAEKLRADVARAALGGSEASRKRHTDRGKLLPGRGQGSRLFPGSYRTIRVERSVVHILCASRAREQINVFSHFDDHMIVVLPRQRSCLDPFRQGPILSYGTEIDLRGLAIVCA